MAKNSSIGTKLCIVWQTEMPFLGIDRTSDNFPLLGSEWYLSCTYLTIYGYSSLEYRVILNSRHKNHSLENSFVVTTFIQRPGRTSNPMLCNLATVKCTEECTEECTEQCIWAEKHTELEKCIEGFGRYGLLKFVILFDLPITSFSYKCGNKTIHISTQTGIDFPLSPGQDVSNRSKGRSSSDKCTQACLELPSGLESLSLDWRKALEQETMPDVKLRCGDRSVSAHRTVLAARSEVFTAMFRNKMSERETGIIDVEDLDASALDLFLEYLYSGKIHQNLNEDTAGTLYAVGDKYAVHSLKKACSEWIIGCLTTENCLGFLILADGHSDDDFKDAVVNFAAEHLQDINRESWGKFNKEHPGLSVDVYNRRFAETLYKDV